MKKTALVCFSILLLLAPAVVSAFEVLFIGPDNFIRQKSHSDAVIKAASIYIESWSIDTSFYFFAPVQLPEGAKISSMVVFFMDNQPDCAIKVELFRQNRYGGTQDTIIPVWTTTDDSATYRTHKLTNVDYSYNKILNNSCTYHVKVRFYTGESVPDWSALKLYGIKIFYQPATT